MWNKGEDIGDGEGYPLSPPSCSSQHPAFPHETPPQVHSTKKLTLVMLELMYIFSYSQGPDTREQQSHGQQELGAGVCTLNHETSWPLQQCSHHDQASRTEENYRTTNFPVPNPVLVALATFLSLSLTPP